MTRPARESGALVAVTGTIAAALVPALAFVLWGALPAAQADPSEEPAPAHAYQAAGPDVSGASSQAQAPLLLPGIHLDSFAEGGRSPEEDTGTVKYYRIPVSTGQRVHAAATIAAPPYADGIPEEPDALSMEVTFVTAGGDACEDVGEDGVGQTTTGDGPVTSSAVSGVVGWDGCPGEELFLRLTRSGTRAGDSPLPVEIQVAVEPAGVGGGSPAVTEEIEDSGAGAVPPADDEPFAPGRSFATAPEMEPGSYILEFEPGEVGVMRIPVQEGQRLRWRVEVTSQPEDAGELSLLVANAVREPVTVRGGSWMMNTDDRVAGGGMTAPVALGNRGSDLSSVASAWLPGTHYVTLQRLQRAADADPAGDEPVTVVLTLEVEGEPDEDAPAGPVLELGETAVTRGPLSSLGIDASWGRLAKFGGAGLLAVIGLVTSIAGVLVLRLRRR